MSASQESLSVPAPSPLRRRTRGLAAAAVGGLMVTSGTMGAGLLVTPAGHAVTACVPTQDRPSLEVADEPAVLGGTISVTGAGFCHPTDGGSQVALKIDEGAYSRLDDDVHPNRTIWFIVEASPTDGTFTVDLPLPSGTTATSVPAFLEGTHTLRGLTGSIKDGDEVRTVKSNEFTVGEHRPTLPPEVLGEDDLEDTHGDAFSVAVAKALTVTLPSGVEGDWVFPTLMLDDGSPSSPWGTWLQLGKGGVVELPLTDLDVWGRHRIVLQNGNAGADGAILGWSWVTIPDTTPDDSDEDGKQPDDKPGKKPGKKPDDKPGKKQGEKPGKQPSTPPVAAPAPTPVPAPVPYVAPAAPVVPTPVALPAAVPASDVVAAVGPVAAPVPAVRAATLPSVYRGWSSMPVEAELPAELDADNLVVQLGVGNTEAYVHLLDKSGNQIPAGWVDATSAGVALLDVRDLADGGYRFSFQSAAGVPIGWAGVDLQGADTDGLRSVNDSTTMGALSERDLWLGGIGLALLAGTGLGAVVTRQHRPEGH